MKEDLKDIFKNVNDWLKYAEAKNAMLLGFNGALLFGVFRVFAGDSKLKQILLFVGPYYNYVFPVLIGISIILLLISFIPETKMVKLSVDVKPKTINLLFYTHLKTLTPDELLSEIGFFPPCSAKQIERNYAEQIIINAGIAAKKYDTFKLAGWITISGLMLIFPVVFPLINYFIKRAAKNKINQG